MKKSKIKRIGDILFEDEVPQEILKRAKGISKTIKLHINSDAILATAVTGEQILKKIQNKFKESK